MPMYLDREVSDDYLQSLIAAYRKGYGKAEGDAEADQGDQAIIDRLTEEKVLTDLGAGALGLQDAQDEADGGDGT